MQVAQSQNVLAGPLGLIPMCIHLGGRVSQESATASGFYIDLPLNRQSGLWRFGLPTGAGDPNLNSWVTSAFISSGMEHGVLEQLQGVSAVSTVNCLYQANTNGQKLILATLNNYSTVSGLLAAETKNKYNTKDKSDILANLTANITMLMSSGTNKLGFWGGYGYAKGSNDASGNLRSFVMGISGGQSGGSVDTPMLISSDFILGNFTTDPLYLYTPPVTQMPVLSRDPVRMIDGAFTVDSTDLSNGQGEPRGLAFSRHYDSNRRTDNSAGMAPGWTHNYIIQASERSDPAAGLGKSTPQAMAAFATGMRAAYEMFSGAPSQQYPQSLRWAATALAAKWAVDQLKSNAVSIALGSQTIQFNKQPDGTFTPPAGLSMTLTKPNGYALQQRHGNTFNFSPTNSKVASIVDLYGKTANFTYAGTNLHTVQDCWTRSLTFGYASGKLTSVTDGTRTVGFGYTNYSTTNYDLASVTDADASTWKFGYGTNHLLTTTKDATGRVMVQNFYDTNGGVTNQWSQGDSAKPTRFYISGQANVQMDPQGGRTTYYFDEKSRLTAVTDPLGNTSQTYYDGQDHVIERVSPMGEVSQFVYDGRNNLTQTVDPLTNTTTFIYDGNDDLQTVTNPRGKVTSYTYNAYHQVQTATAPNANNDPSKPVVTSFVYDPATGNLLTKTDPDSKKFTYSYDGWGMLSSILYPNNDHESFNNDIRGFVTNHLDGNNVLTVLTYNNRGGVLSKTVKRASGDVVTRVVYDANGNAQTSIDANTNSTSFTYSATGKLLTTTLPATPAGTAGLTNQYDSRDWLQFAINPLNNKSVYQYDSAGRLTNAADPLQHAVTSGYDDDGRATWVQSPLASSAQITQFGYNARGEPICATNPASKVVGRLYDANGNLLVVTNERSKVFAMSYYDDNRLSTSKTPLLKATTITYNKRGLVETLKDPLNRLTTTLYDDRGRLQTKTDPVGGSTYTYDKNNNLLTHAENGRQIVRKYDELNRLTNCVDEAGNNVGAEYDNNGNLTRLIYPGATAWVKYRYDSLNHLTNMVDWLGHTVNYQYDIAGRLTNMARHNQTSRRLAYDAANRLTNIAEIGPGAAVIASWAITPDEAGRTRSVTVTPTAVNRMEQSRSMTFDDDNRLSKFRDLRVSYDDAGNLTKGPLTLLGGLVNFAYDTRNRLTCTGPQGVIAGVGYSYDCEGRRVSVTNGASVATFVPNPFSALAQPLTRTANSATTYYIYAPGIGLVYQIDSAGAYKAYHFDLRGSTAAITDGSGNVTDRVEYSPYGGITWRNGATDTPFLFNGRFGVITDANGLLFMRARYYSPLLCRFLNADPLGMAGGLNWYAYANGNPIDEADPFGLCSSSAGMNSQNNSVPNLTMTALPNDIGPQFGPYYNPKLPTTVQVNYPTEDANMRDLNAALTVGKMALDVGVIVATTMATDGLGDFLLGAKWTEEGIIYLRTDAAGAEYVGQAENAARYAARQAEHQANNPTARFTYQELERVPANTRRSLNVAEEDWIRAGGGPRSTGGSLQNARHQMNDLDYRKAGGTITYP